MPYVLAPHPHVCVAHNLKKCGDCCCRVLEMVKSELIDDAFFFSQTVCGSCSPLLLQQPEKKVVIPVKRRAFIKQNLIKLTLKSLQNE